MAIMASQAFPFFDRLMSTANGRFFLPLVMAVQAQLGRLFSQHSGILAGMFAVTRLTIPLLDRFVLCDSRDLFMAGQAKPPRKRLQLDCGAINLVAIVAIATADRRVDHLSEQADRKSVV